MPTFKQYDVVVVAFPFTARHATNTSIGYAGETPASLSVKRRPALIVSDPKSLKINKSILAMITSSSHQPWPLDTTIKELNTAGLNADSIVRMKLFTLDHGLILRTIGKLSQQDLDEVGFNLSQAFGC